MSQVQGLYSVDSDTRYKHCACTLGHSTCSTSQCWLSLLYTLQGGTALSHLQYASPRSKLRQAAFLGHSSSPRRLAWNTSTNSHSAHQPLNSPLQSLNSPLQPLSSPLPTQGQQPCSKSAAAPHAFTLLCSGQAQTLSAGQLQSQQQHESDSPAGQTHSAQLCSVLHVQQHTVTNNAAAVAGVDQSGSVTAACSSEPTDAAGSASKAVICRAISPTRPAVPRLSLAAMQDRGKAASSARGLSSGVCNSCLYEKDLYWAHAGGASLEFAPVAYSQGIPCCVALLKCIHCVIVAAGHRRWYVYPWLIIVKQGALDLPMTMFLNFACVSESLLSSLLRMSTGSVLYHLVGAQGHGLSNDVLPSQTATADPLQRPATVQDPIAGVRAARQIARSKSARAPAADRPGEPSC